MNTLFYILKNTIFWALAICGIVYDQELAMNFFLLVFWVAVILTFASFCMMIVLLMRGDEEVADITRVVPGWVSHVNNLAIVTFLVYHGHVVLGVAAVLVWFMATFIHYAADKVRDIVSDKDVDFNELIRQAKETANVDFPRR